MDLHLNQKKAVVTGASQGIGRAIAKTLAQEGVKLLLTARTGGLLNELRDEIILEGARALKFLNTISWRQMGQ